MAGDLEQLKRLFEFRIFFGTLPGLNYSCKIYPMVCNLHNICKKLHQFEISILESSYFGLRLVKFIPDFIFILQLDYWCLFYVYTEKAVGSHIKSLRHKKARPPTKTGFQSREITALNAPPRGPSPVPLMWSRQKRGGPFNASFEGQNDFLFQMLTYYLNK